MARRAQTPEAAPTTVEDAAEEPATVIEGATLVGIAGRVEFSVGGRPLALDWDRDALIAPVRLARHTPARLIVRGDRLIGVEFA